MREKSGYINMGLTTLILGSSTVAFKYLTGFTSVNIQNFFRFLAASIVLCLITAFSKNDSVKNNNKANAIGIVSLSLVFYLFVQLLITGIALSKANLSAFVMDGIGPIIYILIISLFIPSERKYLKSTYVKISMIVGFIGSSLIMLNSNIMTGLYIDKGLLLVLGATFLWGIYLACVKKYFSDFSPIVLIRNIVTLTTFWFLVTIILTKEIFTLGSMNFRVILGLVVAGIIFDAIANITYVNGITKLPAVKANIFLFIVPMITLIISALILNEWMNANQVIGCILALLSNLFVIYMEYKNSAKNKVA